LQRAPGNVKLFAMKSGRIDCKCQPDANTDDPACLDIGERVIVRCKSYRCLAYCDAQGLWRFDRNNEPLEDDPLEVIGGFRSSKKTGNQ
jgi:hypothetical protein